MVFSSLTFLFYFLPITLILYFLARSRSQKNLVLLIASIFFYAWGEPFYVFLIILSTVNDYVFSNLVQKSRDRRMACSIRSEGISEKDLKKEVSLLSESDKAAWRLEKTWFILSLIINLGLLGIFKYTDFMIANINSLFNCNLSMTNLPLPIGISFYTFQTMSYSIDVYTGKVRAQKNFLTLATYVALFPQLIAGPIVRYQTIEQELEKRNSSLIGVADGLRRFIIGLAKKVLIANQMGLITDTILIPGAIPDNTAVLWLAMLAYTFQIYFDFSGYSDMAIGLGRVFGFHFLENFNYPYTAVSITDFWRKWHISLGTWFRDYVYIPLGGNKKNQYRNIAIVWGLTGLWHGASWNYVLWGMYYGILLIGEKLLKNKGNLPRVIRRGSTFLAVVIGWTIFRLEDMTDLKKAFYGLTHYQPISLQDFLIEYDKILFALPMLVVAVFAAMPWAERLKKWKWAQKTGGQVLYDIYLMMLLALIIQSLVGSGFNPFIYFRF
ncbi:MBOAT family protein [Clostridiales bacterium COT073_COT-073]|nr:MBOAT family protein [Clostridiales bacterium COT073_COT-073]